MKRWLPMGSCKSLDATFPQEMTAKMQYQDLTANLKKLQSLGLQERRASREADSPCQGDAPLAKRHREGLVCMRYGWLCWRCQISVVG